MDSNDWTNDPYGGVPPQQQAHAGNYSGRITSRPMGSDMPLEQIQLTRDDAPMDATSGVINEAFEYFKQYPLYILGMMLIPFGINLGFALIRGVFQFAVQLMFGSTSSYESYDSYGGQGGYDSTVEFGSGIEGADILGTMGGDLFLSGGVPMIGSAGAEIAMVLIVGFGLIIQIISLLIQTYFQAANVQLWLRIARGQQVDFATVLKSTKPFYIPFLLTNLLFGLGFFGGYLLCLVPGFILLFGWIFTQYIVIDKNIAYIDALKASWRMTDGRKLNIFVLALILGLLNLAGALACGVGMLITAPISLGAYILVYNRIAAPGNAYLQDGEGVSGVFE